MDAQLDAFTNTDPEQLRRNAQALRNANPETIRRTNPQMANFSDEQIKFAADQMDMMANNPSMMNQFKEEVERMSPEEKNKMQEDMHKMRANGSFPASETRPAVESTSGFKIGAAVELYGLKNEDFNGQKGVIKSRLKSNGRHEVLLSSSEKTLALKPANLKLDYDRTVDSLSVKELKQVLRAKDVDDSTTTGMDKEQLKNLVRAEVPGDDLPGVLKKLGESSISQASAPVLSAKPDLKTATEKMKQMDPETMKSQARALRAMSPDMVRRSNPQMANFSDAQIQQAADHMEMMANNPSMLKMAAQQMESMTQEQFESQVNSHAQGNNTGQVPSSAAASPGAASNNSSSSSPSGVSNSPAMPSGDMLANMDPAQIKEMIEMLKKNPEMLKSMPLANGMNHEQLLKQLEAFSSMDPDQLKRTLKYAGMAKKIFAPLLALKARADKLCGGYSLTLLFGILAAIFYKLVITRWLSPAVTAQTDYDYPREASPVKDENAWDDLEEEQSEFF
mmetsp:Transcript_60004/g.82149  ORF Transcript_60004/g.82149 Transcript_60004/m.82149 type:complete len:506 (-) Transcript_60004:347-1864(-)|eukprot:CAMPEP_0185752554 /NCGR_PEP_ID=MMETSP1174-20130828/11337_1 /TAXON_ID=35687 /ORGANISM="Dictyocha speculum, Strain CCMP1381" /LENGTH=505 /DNA_ID=CAMNT_0028430045 /DNA_START=31 /DNA_END=1548 /DNA_ORIENTATION=-